MNKTKGHSFFHTPYMRVREGGKQIKYQNKKYSEENKLELRDNSKVEKASSGRLVSSGFLYKVTFEP
jgi:hypothetical protein